MKLKSWDNRLILGKRQSKVKRVHRMSTLTILKSESRQRWQLKVETPGGGCAVSTHSPRDTCIHRLYPAPLGAPPAPHPDIVFFEHCFQCLLGVQMSSLSGQQIKTIFLQNHQHRNMGRWDPLWVCAEVGTTTASLVTPSRNAATRRLMPLMKEEADTDGDSTTVITTTTITTKIYFKKTKSHYYSFTLKSILYFWILPVNFG